MARDLKSRRALLLAALLGAATVAAFIPLFHNGFVRYDDPEYVTGNPRVLAGLTGDNFQWAFTTGQGGNWHPLTWLSHMLDVQLFGLRAGWHHAVSLLFHVANALLLFFVWRKLTRKDWRSFFVAALFALHPLHVESVAWVAERKDVLSAFFFMLTLWAYARYSETAMPAGEPDEQTNRAPGEGSKAASPAKGKTSRLNYYWVALGFFALGLMSKSMLVTLPFVLLLLDFWPLRRGGPSRPLRLSHWLPLVREKLPFFGLAAVSSGIAFVAQRQAHAITLSLPLAPRLANAVASYFKYIGKTLWPADLAVFYPHPATRYPASEQWPGWVLCLAALALCGTVVLVMVRRDSAPWFTVGWLWFLGTLVPVIGVVQVGLQGLADRYTYIPAIGLFVCVVWAVAELAEARSRFLVTAGAAAVLGMCAVLTFRQAAWWRNDLTVFEHALSVDPRNAVAHDHIGIALGEQGKFDEAKKHFRAALAADPNSAEAYYGLGVTLEHQGLPSDAMEQYRHALAVRPWYEPAHSRLGTILWSLGQTNEAMAQYEAGLRLAPEDLEVRYRMGLALRESGAWDQAAAQFAYVARLQPGFGDVLDCLTESLLKNNRTAQAEGCLREVLAAHPDNAPAHVNLGSVLWQRGHPDEAEAEYQAALRLNPQLATAHFNLGTALALKGRYQEAAAEFAAAVRLRPDYVEARLNLGRMLAGDNRFNEAVTQFQEAARLSPTNANLRLDLGSALRFAGRTNEAAACYAEALRLEPGLPETLARSAQSLLARGHPEAAVARLTTAIQIKPDPRYYFQLAQAQQAREPKAAIEAYRQALGLNPDWPPALTSLAWLLATDSRPDVRNGAEAVRLAERACQSAGDKEPAVWITLAAAFAEAGRFNDAVDAAEKGRRLALSTGQTNALAMIDSGLALYKRQQPFRQ